MRHKYPESQRWQAIPEIVERAAQARAQARQVIVAPQTVQPRLQRPLPRKHPQSLRQLHRQLRLPQRLLRGAAATCYIDPEGNCSAGEYCPTSLYGKTVQGSSGPIICEDNNGWRWENA